MGEGTARGLIGGIEPAENRRPGVAAAAYRRPQAILFDWDNTLVDSWGTIHEALNRLMAAMARPLWSLEDTRRQVRHSLRDSFPRIFGAEWEAAQRLYLDHFRAIHLDRLQPLPGRAELLRRLAADGVYLGVVSNKTGAVLRLEAERLGWVPLFGRIVGAGDAPSDKPHPAPVELALEPSGLVPGEAVWLVGDTGLDMQCAHASGCVPVLLGGDFADEEFADFAPSLAFADGEGLFRFLRAL